MRKGAFLLIVDSFSNMSEIEVGKNKYRVHMLLDNIKGLKRASGSDSEWYRLSPELQNEYPIQLENVHYYYRIFQKA